MDLVSPTSRAGCSLAETAHTLSARSITWSDRNGRLPTMTKMGAGEHSTVLLYSDDASVRDAMRLALGRGLASDLPPLEFVDVSTADAVMAAVAEDAEPRIDVLLLDAEAWPAGGMGISRQLRVEVANPPAICVVLARKVDGWLATWSQADAYVAAPIDPIGAARVVADLLRKRRSDLSPIQ